MARDYDTVSRAVVVAVIQQFFEDSGIMDADWLANELIRDIDYMPCLEEIKTRIPCPDCREHRCDGDYACRWKPVKAVFIS